MYTKGDFHLHTTASDGKLSATELVSAGSLKGLSIMAITDHDTTKGVAEALKAGEKYGVKIIPGMELSTIHNKESIHILGFFKDHKYENEAFQTFLKQLYDYRSWRGKQFIANLKIYFDIDIDAELLINTSTGIIARPHIAQAIIDAGYNYDWQYIFDNILSKESPAYVPNKKLSVEEGIKILKEVNAIVVLAHPVLIKKSTIEDLLEFDFDGIEAIYSLNTPEETIYYKKLAKERNKFVTAGSDFHGIGEHDTKHGKLGSIYLEEENLLLLVTELGI